MITSPQYILALDFGGTKLAAGLVELPTGKVIRRVQHPTFKESAEQNLRQMIRIGKALLSQSTTEREPLLGIGISFGGPIARDCKTIIRSMHVPGWEGVALPAIISNEFDLPAAMENDANAAALGEWHFGAARNTQHILYIQISTGIGAGLILNGSPYRGAGIAGEFGHITVLPDGPQCVCGKQGCIESFAAGWAIARDGRALLTGSTSPSLLHNLSHGNPDLVDAKLVIEAAIAGDAGAWKIVCKAFTFLGIGIANVINLLGPEMVILGGGITRAGELLLNTIHEVLQAHLMPALAQQTRVAVSQLGDDVTLLGAAALLSSRRK